MQTLHDRLRSLHILSFWIELLEAKTETASVILDKLSVADEFSTRSMKTSHEFLFFSVLTKWQMARWGVMNF